MLWQIGAERREISVTVVTRFADTLSAVFYRADGTVADAGHTMCTFAAPHGTAVDDAYVIQRAKLLTLTAANAALIGAEGICFDEHGIEDWIYGGA